MPLSGRKGSRRRKCYIQVDCILFCNNGSLLKDMEVISICR